MEIHNRSGYILAYRNRKVGLDQITEGFESLGLKSRMFFIITRGFEGIWGSRHYEHTLILVVNFEREIKDKMSYSEATAIA